MSKIIIAALFLAFAHGAFLDSRYIAMSVTKFIDMGFEEILNYMEENDALIKEIRHEYELVKESPENAEL